MTNSNRSTCTEAMVLRFQVTALTLTDQVEANHLGMMRVREIHCPIWKVQAAFQLDPLRFTSHN